MSLVVSSLQMGVGSEDARRWMPYALSLQMGGKAMMLANGCLMPYLRRWVAGAGILADGYLTPYLRRWRRETAISRLVAMGALPPNPRSGWGPDPNRARLVRVISYYRRQNHYGYRMSGK